MRLASALVCAILCDFDWVGSNLLTRFTCVHSSFCFLHNFRSVPPENVNSTKETVFRKRNLLYTYYLLRCLEGTLRPGSLLGRDMCSRRVGTKLPPNTPPYISGGQPHVWVPAPQFFKSVATQPLKLRFVYKPQGSRLRGLWP